MAKISLHCIIKESFSQIVRSHQWSLYLSMLGKDLQLKTTTLLPFFLKLVKSLKELGHVQLIIRS